MLHYEAVRLLTVAFFPFCFSVDVPGPNIQTNSTDRVCGTHQTIRYDDVNIVNEHQSIAAAAWSCIAVIMDTSQQHRCKCTFVQLSWRHLLWKTHSPFIESKWQTVAFEYDDNYGIWFYIVMHTQLPKVVPFIRTWFIFGWIMLWTVQYLVEYFYYVFGTPLILC